MRRRVPTGALTAIPLSLLFELGDDSGGDRVDADAK
jgi:hypothetical protein